MQLDCDGHESIIEYLKCRKVQRFLNQKFPPIGKDVVKLPKGLLISFSKYSLMKKTFVEIRSEQ